MNFLTRTPRTLFAALLLAFVAGGVLAQEDGGEDATEDENPVIIEYGDQVERLDAFETRFEIALRNLAASQGAELDEQMRAQMSALQPQFLEQRATELGLLVEARNRGLEVDDETVDAEVEQARSNVPEDATFEDLLEQSGIGSEETLRELIRENQLISIVVEEIQSDIEVPEEELRSAYEEQQDSFTTPEQVCASHILLESAEEAESVIEELEGGADFATMAEEHSTGPTASEGGDLGCFGREQMVQPFADEAFEAPVGEVVGPVETEFGHHVILVNERQEAGQQSFEEVREQLETQLSSERVQSEIDAIVEDIDVETYPDRLPEPEVSPQAPQPMEPEGDAPAQPEGEDGAE